MMDVRDAVIYCEEASRITQEDDTDMTKYSHQWLDIRGLCLLLPYNAVMDFAVNTSCLSGISYSIHYITLLLPSQKIACYTPTFFIHRLLSELVS